jgi:hypothetical protein
VTRRLAAFATVAVLAGAGFLPSAAQADGDPASDVLLLQDAYLPYAPGVPVPVAKALNDLLKTTRKAGFPLKVAVIAAPQDLGAVPQYFGKPQSYAPFLESEIAFNAKKPLLVVMAAGYGAAGLPTGSENALKGLDAPASNGDALGRAAIAAVVKLAGAAGHPVPAPKVPATTGGSGGGGTSPLIIFGVPVMLLTLGGALAALRRRQQAKDEATDKSAST